MSQLLNDINAARERFPGYFFLYAGPMQTMRDESTYTVMDADCEETRSITFTGDCAPQGAYSVYEQLALEIAGNAG